MKLYLIAALCLCLIGSAQAVSHVYILTGQSNSLGAVKGTPASPEQLERYSSEGLLWNGNMVRDTGKCFEANPAWEKVAPQLPSYGSLCMGPEYGFSYMMHHHKWHTAGDNKLYIVKASLDGGGNRFWMNGAPAFQSLVSTLKAALAQLKGKPQVQGLIYLQGESDKGEEITHAPERFLDLVNRLKKETKKGVRYAVAGECATWNQSESKDSAGNTTAKLMYAMTQKKKNIGWVRTRDLTKITSGDNMGVHYDGKSQITIGARFAYAVAVLEKLPLGCVRSDDREAKLDEPAAWWGGNQPRATEVATWDVSAANVEELLSGEMHVGGLVVEDPFRGSVCIKGAAPKATLHVGEKGILLKEGDLALRCHVVCRADQTWVLPATRKIELGTAADPVALSMEGKAITVKAAAGAALELHLKATPQTVWHFPEGMPQLQATIAGKPAKMVEKDGAAYSLEPVGE